MLCIPISSLILLYCSRTFSWSKKLISIKMWFLGFVMILKHIICLPFRKPTLALYHSLVVLGWEKMTILCVLCGGSHLVLSLFFEKLWWLHLQPEYLYLFWKVNVELQLQDNKTYNSGVICWLCDLCQSVCG